MTKSKQKRKGYSIRGPLPPDDPIYTSGYIMLRPVHGRKQEKAKTDSQSPSESDDQQTADKEEGS